MTIFESKSKNTKILKIQPGSKSSCSYQKLLFSSEKSLKAAENSRKAGKWIINIDEKRPNNEILGGPAPESTKWKTFLQDNAVVLGGKPD